MISLNRDYRVTEFCPPFDSIQTKKDDLVRLIRKKHPRAIDLYDIISPNDSEYKIPFMVVYNYKCSYCGVSIDIIPKDNFEIDHFIYKKNKSKFKTVAEAGYIENLVLACRRCNHHKSNHTVPDNFLNLLNPDLDSIKSIFVRDDKYKISIAKEYVNSPVITNFYNQLQLRQEIHRLDYLLMQMLGRQSSTENTEEYRALGRAISILRKRRNLE